MGLQVFPSAIAMSDGSGGADMRKDGLRERKAQHNVNFGNEPESDGSISEEEKEEEEEEEEEKDKKTIGRTPDGTGECQCTWLMDRDRQQLSLSGPPASFHI